MRAAIRSKLRVLLMSLVSIAAISLPLAMQAPLAPVANAATQHTSMNCVLNSRFCSEVYDSQKVFGGDQYIGHDEPSVLFYSNRPGSGNQMRYNLTLPKDPSASQPLTPGKSFNFELHPAFFFGMAMCDTQSFPEQVSTCTPDSDTNIVDPAVSAAHPGTAFMEMQFYPPGWVSWPAGNSCAPTQWCAALNIDSLSQNPVSGQSLNATCQGIAGLEYVNFAFITKNGKPQPNSPPNPVNSTLTTFTPNRAADLFMNSGDNIVVTMHDTQHGLQIALDDRTTGQSGSMTTSAANGFGQVKFAPDPSTECTNIPYDFHPMYSTSSEATRVPWAAHSYNIAFSDETGHFDACTNVDTTNGTCIGNEGSGSDQEPADGDDNGCHAASESLLVKIAGCSGTNTGFDGTPYQNVWPDGNTKLHPTPITFTSPLTGYDYDTNYSRIAFEADLPRIEGTCNRSTGAGCTLIPITDDGTPAAFYPFFNAAQRGDDCSWMEGNHIPGTRDFGRNAQYGSLLPLVYTNTGGTSITRFNDFRQVISHNPCAND
ncbi:MAG: hypothetical protein ACRDHZ_00925 [Ktedonobacteraceae bacterium]